MLTAGGETGTAGTYGGTIEAEQTIYYASDTLVAGAGPTELIGGPADETYIVNSASDFIQENWSGTNSVVRSSVSYTLPAYTPILTLTGTANLTGTDYSGRNSYTNDTLISNSGIDTLIGGASGDVYVINNASDVILPHLLTDTIQASVNYVLPATVNVLTLAAAGLKGTANGGSDTLISSTAGIDTLVGGPCRPT